MENEYMKYPSTVKALAKELKKVCNDYNSRQIGNDRIKEIIDWYAANQAEKLFAADQINPTISKIIGKKRLSLITDLLEAPEENGGK